jgi:hypothetical protein
MLAAKRKKLLTKVLAQMFIVALLSLGVAGLVQAETWTFSVPNGDVLSNTHSYNSSPIGTPIVATADLTTVASPTSGTWTPGALTAIDLFGKTLGGTETGLGILAPPLGGGTDSDNEIVNKSYVLLNLSNVLAKGFTSLTMSIGSIQTGEGYSLWSGNVGGPLSLLRLRQNTGPGSITDVTNGIDAFTLALNFGNNLFVSATPGISQDSDILIRDGASAVPLPPSVLLLGSGLLGLVGLGWRRAG